MTINFLILFVLLALTIGAGWLTWRAVRAKRLWVKIAGGLGAGLLTLVLAAVTFLGGKGMAAAYFPGAPSAPDLKVAGTPEQIARGEYLANITCVECHGAGGSGEQPLTGGYDLFAAEGFGFIGQAAPENLTPAGKLANYSDGEIFRVLRHGVDQDGRLLALMSGLPIGEMSDEDLQALIAYLRSLPPASTDGPLGDQINFVGMVFGGAGLVPPVEKRPETISAPPQGITAEYGKYVATFGDCRGCHGPDMTGTPASALFEAVPNPRPLVSELTLEQFVEMMRSGVRPGNNPFPDAMPWESASKMTDDDLAALYAYLTAPVK
jgi:mono/diheme cytochrome c family protein